MAGDVAIMEEKDLIEDKHMHFAIKNPYPLKTR